VNPFDWKIMEGMYQKMMPIQLPATLGGDFSGVVTEAGEGVSFKKGDAVYGSAIILSGGSGAFAEFASAGVDHVAKKPKNLNHLEAAALPLTGVSAWQALVDHIGLAKGNRILIHGAAGGIGTSAVQIAKHLGAHVAATASARDMDYVKGLGADEVIDYKSQSFDSLLSGYDAVYDTVGGDTYAKSFKVLKKGGIIVSMLEQPKPELTEKYGVKAIAQGTHINGERLSKVAGLVELGVLKVHVDKSFPLEKAGDALAYQKTGHPRGKVVLKIKD
jgi:NADPH:quinone reductase-like Zn-dependent oxidoreductase